MTAEEFLRRHRSGNQRQASTDARLDDLLKNRKFFTCFPTGHLRLQGTRQMRGQRR